MRVAKRMVNQKLHKWPGNIWKEAHPQIIMKEMETTPWALEVGKDEEARGRAFGLTWATGPPPTDTLETNVATVWLQQHVEDNPASRNLSNRHTQVNIPKSTGDDTEAMSADVKAGNPWRT